MQLISNGFNILQRKSERIVVTASYSKSKRKSCATQSENSLKKTMDVLHEATEMVETIITFYTDIILPAGTHLQPKPYND